MKKIIYIVALSFFYLESFSQKIREFQTGGQFGSGLVQMRDNVSNTGGIYFAYYHGISNTPLSVGLNYAYNSYGSHSMDMLPFNWNGYDPDVADITNTHGYHYMGINVRYEPAPHSVVSPFVSVGVGRASHASRWRAVDPFDDDCPRTISRNLKKDGTFTTRAEVGTNLNLTRLFNDRYKPEDGATYLSFSAAIERGGRVEFFNSQVEQSQFAYATANQKDQLIHPADVSSESGTTSTEPFNNRHMVLQFNVNLIFRVF